MRSDRTIETLHTEHIVESHTTFVYSLFYAADRQNGDSLEDSQRFV